VQSCTKAGRRPHDLDPFFRNSPLAEQSNGTIDQAEDGCILTHTNQFTLIWRIRWMPYSINKTASEPWRCRQRLHL
jgi:hypothetical protein